MSKFLLTEQDMERVWALTAARIAAAPPQSSALAGHMPALMSRSLSTGSAFYRSLADYIVISEQLGRGRDLTASEGDKQATIQVRTAETGSGLVVEIDWKASEG